MSETTSSTVELTLLNNVYKLACPVEHQPQLRLVGERLEEKFQAMRSANPRLDHQKIVMMIALQLMQEIMDLNKTIQDYSKCETVLSNLVENLDKKLAALQ